MMTEAFRQKEKLFGRAKSDGKAVLRGMSSQKEVQDEITHAHTEMDMEERIGP